MSKAENLIRDHYVAALKRFDELQQRDRLPSERSILDIPDHERKLAGYTRSRGTWP